MLNCLNEFVSNVTERKWRRGDFYKTLAGMTF